MNRLFKALGLLTLALCFSASANQQTVGDYVIHYQALGSTFLTPAIAKAYGLQRSNYTGIVNISVLHAKEKDSPGVPVEITGIAKNLLDSSINLKFREIREGKAVYYIAEVPYRSDETIHFQIGIKHGRQLNTTLKFKQNFFTD
ncbi:MAG: DUF4426 domain-containing protein [Shewanella sp.]|nr:DUF4426 domain-containing protein [Shewanella sp.]MCF1430019.1 DUF4426 domain-containing protein [Shewanella sp.]MCF1437835.1 DUF4426 domain-containing protein [Shewanella sp.]MCF1456405.1 DUF4426 domain-containing protein [Shewanella sp.]